MVFCERGMKCPQARMLNVTRLQLSAVIFFIATIQMLYYVSGQILLQAFNANFTKARRHAMAGQRIVSTALT